MSAALLAVVFHLKLRSDCKHLEMEFKLFHQSVWLFNEHRHKYYESIVAASESVL